MIQLQHQPDALAHQFAPSAGHVCGDDHLADPAHRLSAHRTSVGTVVYYRCSCGRVRVGRLARR